MAPELFPPRCERASAASDIYSLGAIFYDLVFGTFDKARRTFTSPRPIGMQLAVSQEKVPMPDHPNVELTKLLVAMLDPDPAQRPSAQAVLDHPFFSLAPSRDMAQLDTLRAEKEALLGPMCTCVVCGDQVRHRLGLSCPDQDRKHTPETLVTRHFV